VSERKAEFAIYENAAAISRIGQLQARMELPGGQWPTFSSVCGGGGGGGGERQLDVSVTIMFLRRVQIVHT
jgi:hypothetical protein